MMKTDLIIIGAGPGGYRAASYAAQKGLKVVIFEQANVGGTCLNEGCIPTKSYARNAELVQTLKEAELFGLNDLRYNFDFAQVLARKNEVIAQLRAGIDTLLSHPNITVVHGEARFLDACSLCCNTVAAATETYTAPAIIVATGSVPKSLRVTGAELALDSSDLLQLDRLPESLCIVGAGVIGMEFASIFSAFGTKVTVVEFLKECLPALDSDIAKRLRKVLEKRGVEFNLQCGVTGIERSEDSTETKVVGADGRGPGTSCLRPLQERRFRVRRASRHHRRRQLPNHRPRHLCHRRRQWSADAGPRRRVAGQGRD